MPNSEYLEQWKPVTGYEGFYEISAEGDVRSLGRGRIIKPDRRSPTGVRFTRSIVLCRQGTRQRFEIESLVSDAFNLPTTQERIIALFGSWATDFSPRARRMPKKQMDRLLKGKLAYYGNRCRYCRVELVKRVNLTWDHAIPRSRGGTDLIANLLPCCMSCNAHKSAKTIFEYLGLT
jgi:5-methylcytosine-specific restriction endonuclease McrA